MKKLITLFLLAATICSHAQEGMFVGARGAFGITYYTPQNNYGLLNRELDYKLKIGYNAGLRFGYNFNEENGLLGEFNFNKQGNKYHDAFTIARNRPKEIIDKEVDLNYLGGALLYRFSPITRNQTYKENPKGKFYLLGGLGINKLISAKVEYFKDGILDTAYPTNVAAGYQGVSNDKDLYKSIDVNLILEIGGDIYLTDHIALQPSFRTQFGLNDQNADKFRVHDEYNASRNLFFGINVGLVYYFSR